ncbi:hypothetical protein, partial [Paraglaciecola sp.]|uniref:hypothetical protein n=1 Tax=Paraglaciecola sp. TaxID=1920173 RepID=UPI00273FEB51
MYSSFVGCNVFDTDLNKSFIGRILPGNIALRLIEPNCLHMLKTYFNYLIVLGFLFGSHASFAKESVNPN